MLKVENLVTGYGTRPVLHGVSFDVGSGEAVALIGPNNAGKSTLLKTIAGIIKPFSGKITVDGIDLISIAPHLIPSQGVVLVPEGRLLFPEMTVEENLLLGSHNSRAKRNRRVNFERVYQLFPQLSGRTEQLAGTLSGGEQQMLAIGRGLMADPSILLLDEPSLGLAPLLVQEIFDAIHQLNRQGLTALIVDQNVDATLEITGRAYVIVSGEIRASGESRKLAGDERIQKMYLGLPV